MAGINIPETCGAILLPSCTLFPQGAFPLHIFEPRYKEMLEDALQDNCMMCVGTLLGDETDNPGDCVAPVGTIGLIRASRKQEDGRSNLILHGLIRVRFEEWLDEKPYPVARLQPLVSVAMPEEGADDAIAALREEVQRVLEPLPSEVGEQFEVIFEKVGGEAGVLADCVAQQLVQEGSVRRILLEELDVKKRIELLISYLRKLADDQSN